MIKKIADISVFSEVFTLIKPYKLSFYTLTHFTSIQIKIVLDSGHSSTAEVVPLYGYSEETEDDIKKYLSDNLKQLKGLDLKEARNIIAEDIRERPFSTTSILTAMDLFTFECNLISVDKASTLETIIPVDTTKPEVYKKVSTVCNTVKVKLSGNLNDDIAFFEEIKKMPKRSNLVLRLDANQGYILDDAILLYDYLSENSHNIPSIEYVEQPLGIEEWEGVEELVKQYRNVPTMLDESIVTKEDIDKAVGIGVSFIKLKLFKQGGIKELIDLSEYAHNKGVNLILGNGVATWLSNRVELSVYNQYNKFYYKAHEANGYLKLQNL